MVKFTASKYESEIIGRIANRAVAMAAKAGLNYTKRNALMDLEACHSNGCPIKLDELEKADDFDFFHDVFGIRRHINRETGQLQNCFLPRCAMSEKPSEVLKPSRREV